VAEEILSHISYYRLSAYFRPFRIQGSEDFAGASFDDVMALYRFDKDLRSLIDDALETIEIHFRTRLTYHLAMADGAFAHANPALFMPSFDHADCMDRIKELGGPSSDKFVSHFRTKYHEEEHLPIWMATELMSFGTISRMYGALTIPLKKAMVDGFDIHYSILTNWLHTLSYVRNICAHHGRLWNRELAIRPIIPYKNGRWPYLGVDNTRSYAILVLILDMLSRITVSNRCHDGFANLLATATPMQLRGMRVPTNWQTFRPWFIGPLPR
jgi:abortive infection bacteriophage resistance protein